MPTIDGVRLTPRFTVTGDLVGPWTEILAAVQRGDKDVRGLEQMVRTAKQQAVNLNTLLVDLQSQVQQLLSTQAPKFYDQLTPAELPDGVRVTFTLAVAPNPVESLNFQFEGQTLYLGQKILSVSGNRVTLTFAPATGSRLRYWCRA